MSVLAAGTRNEDSAFMVALLGYAMSGARGADSAGEGQVVGGNIWVHVWFGSNMDRGSI